jgi:hypothetical protein
MLVFLLSDLQSKHRICVLRCFVTNFSNLKCANHILQERTQKSVLKSEVLLNLSFIHDQK